MALYSKITIFAPTYDWQTTEDRSEGQKHAKKHVFFTFKARYFFEINGDLLFSILEWKAEFSRIPMMPKNRRQQFLYNVLLLEMSNFE